MTSHGILRRARTIAIAVALTIAVNFAISEVVSSRSIAAETGGVEMPVPPRPAPSAVDGGVEMPVPPRP